MKADPVLLFDALTGRQESVFTEAGTRVERLAFHPNSDSLVAATWHGELIWGSVERDGFRLVADAAQRALAFSRDGLRLGYSPSRGELGLVEVAVPTLFRPWRMVSQPAQATFPMAVSANGRWVANATGSRIHLWDAERRAEAASLPLPAPAWWVTVLFGPADEFLYYSATSFGVRRVALVLTNSSDGQAEIRFGRDELLSEPGGWTANEAFADRHRETPGPLSPVYHRRVVRENRMLSNVALADSSSLRIAQIEQIQDRHTASRAWFAV